MPPNKPTMHTHDAVDRKEWHGRMYSSACPGSGVHTQSREPRTEAWDRWTPQQLYPTACPALNAIYFSMMHSSSMVQTSSGCLLS